MQWKLVPQTVPTQTTSTDCGPFSVTFAAFVAFAGEYAFLVEDKEQYKHLISIDKNRTNVIGNM